VTTDRETPNTVLTARYIIERLALVDGRPKTKLGWMTRWRIARAIRILQKHVIAETGDYESRFWLGKAYQRLGDHNHALEWMIDAVRLHPANPSFAKEAGIEALEIGETDVAIALLRPALDAAPRDPALLYDLGMAFLIKNKPREAKNYLSMALAIEDHTLTRRVLALADDVLKARETAPNSLVGLRRWLARK
jgi:Flp pilus assembly protein TadD